MRKDVREFIRRLEAVGLTVESTPGHYHVLRDSEPLRKSKRKAGRLPTIDEWRKTQASPAGLRNRLRRRP